MPWIQTGQGDFDGDGDADLLWRHSDGPVTIWEMEGGQYVVNHNQPEVPAQWDHPAIRDFNGDGDDDILWAHESGALTIWEMSGLRYQVNHNLPSVSSSWQLTDTAKYDGDADYDLQWTNSGTGQVVYWEIEDHQFVRHAPTLVPEAPPENSLSVSVDGSDWTHLFGTNRVQPTGNPWSIQFDPNLDIDYVVTSAGGLNLDEATGLRMTFEVDGSGFRASEGDAPLTVGFMISAGGPLGSRIWSHEGGRALVQDGVWTLEVVLDPSTWTGVFGEHDARSFEATLNGADTLAVTFGGQFFGHGGLGSGTFTLEQVDVLF